MEIVTDFIFLGSKNHCRVVCSHKLKDTCSLEGKKWHTCAVVIVTQSYLTFCDPVDYSMPGFSVLHNLPEFAQTDVYWVGDAIKLSHPMLFPSPPAFSPSQYQSLFQWVSSSIKWLKCWNFSFSINPSNEYSELISFRIDWLDFLAVQEILKHLLQHHSSKASILRCSNSHIHTWKTVALTRWTFVA